MSNENVITIIGNLADDPDLRYTPSGTPVTNIRVAVNRRRRDPQTNEWTDELDGFFTCNVWRDMAENVAESLYKGARVLVQGRIRNRSYENQQGQTVWVTEIEADEVCPSLRWATAKVQKVQRGGGPRGGHPADRAGGGYGGGMPPSGGGMPPGGGGMPPGGGGMPPGGGQPPTPDDVPF